ncbi:MAG: PepSY domain-containing protein [Alphaproteobacteria bacterium]
MNRTAIAAAAILGMGLFAGAAAASDRCNVPMADWQPRETLQQKLEAQGWTVKRIKVEDGCYEAYAQDREGKRVEAYFDPKSLEAVRIESDD